MGGRRVVQDSDDESNAPDSPPADRDDLELSLSPIVDLHYSSPPKLLSRSTDPATESTG